MAAATMFGSAGVQLKAVVSEKPDLIKLLRPLDPIEAASTFAGLLTVPELQSNCIRLESLVHLALGFCGGQRKPNQNLIARLFAISGKGICGRYEDPAEDMFVSSIGTPRGNFRLLEGTWESAGFYLQRIVNVVEGMPHEGGYNDIRECVYSLLRFSDLVCERAKIVRNQLGNQIPAGFLTQKIANQISSIKRLVRFSEGELKASGISTDHLAQFVFDPNGRNKLLTESLGNSTLERYPIACHNDDIFFILPTAVSVAIRRFIIESFDTANMRETFLAALANEYAYLFSRTPLLGGRMRAPIKFTKTKNGIFSGALTSVDDGRYLHFVFFIDTLEDFEKDGLVGCNPDPIRLADDIDREIDHAYEAAFKEDDFRDGITIVVGCGVGRSNVPHIS